MTNKKPITPYPSIPTFLNFLRAFQAKCDLVGVDDNGDPVYNHITYPTLDFKVTLKVGGTNMSIVWKDNQWHYQSRDMLLDVNDYSGFKTYMSKYTKNLDDLHDIVKSKYPNSDIITIYGEWCGKGIPEKASISKTEGKKWIIFGLQIDDVFVDNFEELQDNSINIYNILQFPTYETMIDFDSFPPMYWESKVIPAAIQEFTDKYATNCPIAKHFGVEGIGEGLVFTNEEYGSFKVKTTSYGKGEIEVQQKEKTTNPILDNFVEEVCTNSRMEQFANKLLLEQGNLSPKQMKTFFTLVIEDIKKEEIVPTINWEQAVQATLRTWFINKCKQ
jgi:hypothetical protein